MRLVQTRSRVGLAAEPLYIGRILGELASSSFSATTRSMAVS